MPDTLAMDSAMSAEAWTALAIYVVSQFLALGGVVFVLKGDTKMLKVQVTGIVEEMKVLRTLLIEVALQKQQLANLDTRQIAQGKRLDELGTRLNRFVDMRAIPIVAGENHQSPG